MASTQNAPVNAHTASNREEQNHKDEAHSVDITRLESTISAQDARINELETALSKHQVRTGDEAPAEQIPIDDNSTSDDDAAEEYCYCLRPEYGDMVACDNPDCERKWFHLHHTNLHYMPDEDDSWVCTLCRGWEPLNDGEDGCWRCPKCS
jgi:hypothetical protein